jgi:NADPH-dependent curcumin reductase CurA
MLGMTAWSGTKIQCEPQPGETVVVSAASGGVGQCAGQIAKQLGCRVVGIAGPAEKCEFVTDVLGFDACVSYRAESFHEDLAAACPDGCDVYFENVGGDVWAAVILLLNKHARVTRCGLMSQQVSETGTGAKEWEAQGAEVIAKQEVNAQSLFVGTAGGAAAAPGDPAFQAHEQDFLSTMGGWVASGAVRYKEDLRPGLENAPLTFQALLSPGDASGSTFGKTLVGVGEDPTLSSTIASARDGANVLTKPSL